MAPILSRLADIYGLTFAAGIQFESGTGLIATGGIINDYTEGNKVYRAHIFTSSGKFTVTSLGEEFDTADSVEYVVVGGGGGGGQYGGAGAGGYRSSVTGESSGGGNIAESRLTVDTSPGEYIVTIGAGGEASDGNDGNDGTATSFGPISALGGGYGARYNFPGGDGGSGGAGGDYPRNGRIGNATGYPGPTAQGYPAGHGFSDQTNYTTGGGGGGAGAQGGGGPTASVPITDAPSTPADGGNGIRTLIAGPGPDGAGYIGTPGPASAGGVGGSPSTAVTNGWLAGGGGGGGYAPVSNNGGAGGGGNGNGGHPGAVNTGGGGGYSTGRGGSGIVVVRYQIASTPGVQRATGGRISYYGGKTIHTFTSSGTFATTSNWIPTNVEYVVVGGGGGGSSYDIGGGGGAGGYITNTNHPIGTHPVSVTVQVGSGGIGGSTAQPGQGTSGTPSYFGTPLTGYGGGTGGYPGARDGIPGGSGGGAGYAGPAGGDGDRVTGTETAAPITPQGNPGGSADGTGSPHYGSGGGGGAGSAGGDGSSTTGGGAGGDGIRIPSTFHNPVPAPGPGTGPQVGGGLG